MLLTASRIHISRNRAVNSENYRNLLARLDRFEGKTFWPDLAETNNVLGEILDYVPVLQKFRKICLAMSFHSLELVGAVHKVSDVNYCKNGSSWMREREV
jgi:hypothetical protein